MVKRASKYSFKVIFVIILLAIIYDYRNDFIFITRLTKRNASTRSNAEVLNRIYSIFIDQPTKSFDINRCPNFTISNSDSHDYSQHKCQPKVISPSDCDRAIRKYGKTPKDRGCPKLDAQQVISDLCKFTESSIRTSNVSKLNVECNLQPCGSSSIRIGIIQPKYGLFVRPEFWYVASNAAGIDMVIRKILREETIQLGIDFCFISCEFRKKLFKQALVFPPFLRLKKHIDTKTKKKFNVNIVVLDSVSRQHFYRQLPDSVDELRKIERLNDKVKVLDFEMLQSIAPRTFPNMRAMFSGIVDIDSDDDAHTYGLGSLFGKFSNLGYQTVLQEDSCWYDQWGALITDNKHNTKVLSQPEEYSERWQYIQKKLRRLPIHSYGLTHFSCEVFMQYGKTNQFNDPPKVCFNGHLLPAYFLNYTYKFLQTIERTASAYPGFIYTHLNTGHETSGKRVAYADGLLADFIQKSAKLDNTLTIILSDHGPKTTKFSQEYLAGRYEIGQALMFMIIPDNVQTYLSKPVMTSLTINQHRFISHLDLFHTLMSIHSDKPSGLLEPIPINRDCHDIPIYSFMACLCDGWVEHLVDFHEQVHWLAEYAVGYLNNIITTKRSPKGYGRCERLIGKRYDKIRRDINKDGKIQYTFDVIVEKYRDEEVFEVVVHEKQLTDIVLDGYAEMIKWRRVSIFQHFSKCQDDDIDVQLCICRKESREKTNLARDVAKVISLQSFRVESKVKFLDSKCLAVITRTKAHIFKSYVITNQCVDRLYNVTFNLKLNYSSKKLRSSYNLPQNITTYPWLLYFMTSIPLFDSDIGTEITEDISFIMLNLS